ncbi:hypothetical protein [Xylella fastidiosa]|uniref:phage baseplate plug family protein n=2 Tax=Xylella fastidiosa TaxID=2371 RepID=UPI00090A81D3|nr:hypothetical protein [Xylella fastidiosa]ALR02928.1 hypothetical protein OY18_12785 [Xylella fastidiosa]MDG5823189.1 hypothetical protein [Xylella fastidiosa subsp. pauca]MDG5826462.1 hypothetical protein [Xylella fastidiosa subsp. pauca]
MRQISVDSSPYQTQSFQMAGDALRLILRWNPVPCCWSMDLYTATLDQPVAHGHPVANGGGALLLDVVDDHIFGKVAAGSADVAAGAGG